jgi:hypothetical protein
MKQNNIFFNTPVLFIIFNRPETTFQVFEKIKKARPKQFFIAADGPRGQVENENNICQQLREKLLILIDWDCEVKTLFQEKNIGCRKAVEAAINWFFQNVEQGIILEDDCCPADDFFGYCQYMLERYKNQPEVAMISGTNFLFQENNYRESYFFSKHFAIWGWATWREKWNIFYKNELDGWSENKKNKWLFNFFKDKNIARFYTMTFDKMVDGLFDTWDINWNYSLLRNNQLTVTPLNNLISNLGIIGTHSKYTESKFFNMSTGIFDLKNIIPPVTIEQNKFLDSIQYLHTGLSLFSWRITLRLFFKKIRILRFILYLKNLLKF